MKKFLLFLLSWVLSFSIVWFGMGLFAYYLSSESTITNFLIGLVGFLIGVNPAMERWEQLFEKWFKIDKK
jgi:ABC-type uncharacterized transport system permease subunit